MSHVAVFTECVFDSDSATANVTRAIYKMIDTDHVDDPDTEEPYENSGLIHVDPPQKCFKVNNLDLEIWEEQESESLLKQLMTGTTRDLLTLGTVKRRVDSCDGAGVVKSRTEYYQLTQAVWTGWSVTYCCTKIDATIEADPPFHTCQYGTKGVSREPDN